MGNVIRFGIYRVAFIAFLMLGFSLLEAQESDLPVQYSTDRTSAFEDIKALKNGALIVRLRTNSKKVDAYRSAGNESLALKLEEQLIERNRNMLLGFKQNFNFCSVYFIYSNDYKYLLEGRRSGYFVNDKLEIDSSIVLNELFYLFCDFGPVYVQAFDNQIDPLHKVETSTPAFQEALVIKNLQLNQLMDPFPAFVKVRLYEFDEAADKLSKNLFAFLAKDWSKKGKKSKDE
jgi:hypothetical protein